MIVAGVSSVLMCTYFGIRQKFLDGVDVCPDVLWVCSIFLDLIVTPYLLRSIHLYYLYYVLNEAVGLAGTDLKQSRNSISLAESPFPASASLSKPLLGPAPRSFSSNNSLRRSLEWFFRSSPAVQEKYLLVVLGASIGVVVVFVLCLQFALFTQLDGNNQKECLRLVAYVILGIAIFLMAVMLFFVLLTWLLRAVHDEHDMNRELQVVCFFTTLCMVAYFALIGADYWWPPRRGRSSPYAAYPFIVLIFVTFVASFLWPLVRSYQVQWNGLKTRASLRNIEEMGADSKGSADSPATLKGALSNPVQRKNFTTFLARSFELQSLRFYEGIISLKRMTQDDEARNSRAREMIKLYVGPDAPQEIPNMTSQMKDHLIEVSLQRSIPVDIFAEMEKWLLRTLEDDMFPRFLLSSTLSEYKKRESGRAARSAV